MPKVRLTILALLLGALAVVLPVMLAVQQADRLGHDAVQDLAMTHAQDILRRTELSLDQAASALGRLAKMVADAPCSDAAVQLMRDLVLASSRLHGLGHVAGNRLECSSAADRGAGPDLGPVALVTSRGISVRPAVTFPIAPDVPLLALGRDAFVAFLHPGMLLDAATNADDVSLAAFTLDEPRVQFTRGTIPPHWIDRAGIDGPEVFVDQGHIVALVVSTRYRAGALVAVPSTRVGATTRQFAWPLVPLGLGLCVALLAFLSALLRQDFTLRDLTEELRERIKELTLLHKTASLLQGSKAPEQVMLTELAALLPPAFRHPTDCASRITYGNLEAATSGWREGASQLSNSFATEDGRRGAIEVVYLNEHRDQNAGAGPFLREEGALLASVGDMLTAQLERRAVEHRITRLAYFEPITGLPNRVSLEAHLAETVRATAAADRSFALILMNLRAFRDVNETLGHRNGDELLRYVTQDLRAALFEKDMLASLGGDEFAIVLASLAQPDDIDKVVAKIQASLRHPTTIAGIPVKVEIAIGVALFPDHGDSPDLLWQHADVALRAAREHSRDFMVYAPEIDHYHPQRIALLGELLGAIENDELVLHYQPKIDLRTGAAVGVEALVRWQHPAHGLIYPDRFIFLAERTQLINALTRAIVKRALRECRALHAAGFPLGLSVNLSARNLVDGELCAEIPDLAIAAGIPLELLTLEITETAIISDPERALHTMAELDRLGIALSLDDFGVGQSSLTYMKDMPVTKLKIDKSFVMGLVQERNAAIVTAAINMGHSLGMQVTAEGVETEWSRDRLRDMGCDLGQGYLFAKPLPPDTLLERLRGFGPSDAGVTRERGARLNWGSTEPGAWSRTTPP